MFPYDIHLVPSPALFPFPSCEVFSPKTSRMRTGVGTRDEIGRKTSHDRRGTSHDQEENG